MSYFTTFAPAHARSLWERRRTGVQYILNVGDNFYPQAWAENAFGLVLTSRARGNNLGAQDSRLGHS